MPDGSNSRGQVSDDAERSVLVKLKTECGYQFTSKLESMFTDIKTSADTMRAYKAKRPSGGPASSSSSSAIDLSVQASPLLLCCVCLPVCTLHVCAHLHCVLSSVVSRLPLSMYQGGGTSETF